MIKLLVSVNFYFFQNNFEITQTQLDLQTQLEQSTSDLTIQPLFNDSPVLFLESIDQVHVDASKQVEETEHNTTSPKEQTPPENSHETPPPKKKNEILKYPLFFSLPIYPTILNFQTFTFCKPKRDDRVIPILSQNRFTFEAQMTSLYMHPTDYTFRQYDKNRDFYTSFASKMSNYQYCLDNGVKNFSLPFNFRRQSICDLK